MQSTNARVEFADGIRAVASLYVVAHHVWLTAFPQYLVDGGPWYLRWLAYGQLAVAAFIVLSGFSLTLSPARHEWQQPRYLEFMRRRAWRILPTYWAALALSCPVFGWVTPDVTGSRVSLKAVLVHLLLLQDVVDSPKPNGTFWSIAIEWQIYFFFPLFIWIVRRSSPRALLALVSAGVIGIYALGSNNSTFSPLLNITPQFVVLFVMGMAAAALVERRPHGRYLKVLSVIAGVLGVVVVAILYFFPIGSIESQYFWIDILLGSCVALAVAAMLIGGLDRLRQLLELAPLRSAGRFSYSIYLVHLPILWLVWYFLVLPLSLPPLGNFALLAAVGIPTAVGGSYWFSLVFERPFLTHRSFRAVSGLVVSRFTTRQRRGTRAT